MSWVFLFSLPLGGYLATRLRAPNIVMFMGLAGTVVVGGLILYTDAPLVTFARFGVLYAAGVPFVAALPVVGGYFKDIIGTAASSVLFGVAMMMATLIPAGPFRLAQAYVPVRVETDS